MKKMRDGTLQEAAHNKDDEYDHPTPYRYVIWAELEWFDYCE